MVGSISIRSSVTGSATHTPPPPTAMAPRLDPGSEMVCVTLSVAGSIRATVAPTVLAVQIAPPPLTMLPGSPPTRIRSTAAPEPGSMRATAPPSGSVAQTELAPLLTASGAPFEPRDGRESARGCTNGHKPVRACERRWPSIVKPKLKSSPAATTTARPTAIAVQRVRCIRGLAVLPERPGTRRVRSSCRIRCFPDSEPIGEGCGVLPAGSRGPAAAWPGGSSEASCFKIAYSSRCRAGPGSRPSSSTSVWRAEW